MDSLRTRRVGRRAVLGAGAVAAAGAMGSVHYTFAQGVPGTRTVRFAYFGTQPELDAYQALISAFQAAHPTISVVPLSSPQTTSSPSGMPQGPYMDWLQTSFVGSTPPDVYLLNYRQLGQYITAGNVEPIGPYLRASFVLHESDFYPIALDAFRWPGFPDGGLAALPQNASSLGVFYNVDLFKRHGLALPEAGWTWDDFTRAATTLTTGRHGDGLADIYGLVVEPTIARYAPFVWGAGGDLVDNVAQPTRFTLDTPASQAGLNWFNALGPQGLKVTPPEAAVRQWNDLDRFRGSGAAMLFQSRRVVPILRQSLNLSWDVAPLPVGRTAANVLHSDGFCLATGAQDKEAAWTFIEYALGPDGQRLLAATGRTVPSLREVAESDAFLKGSPVAQLLGLKSIPLPPAHGQVFVENLAISRRLPSSAAWSGLEAAFNKSFARAFYADANIKGAVSSANNVAAGVLGSLFLLPMQTAAEE